MSAKTSMLPVLRFEFGSELIVDDITEHPFAIVAHAEGRTVSEKREIATEIINRCNSYGAMAAAMGRIDRAYVRVLELARERITELGGDCDSVEKMERDDPELRQLRAALKACAKKEST